MDLTKYANIFGEPNKGVHSYRIYNFAIVDVLGTVGIAYILSNYIDVNLIILFILLIIISIPIHNLFGVKTTLTEKIKNNN